MRPRPAEIGEYSVSHEFRDVAFEGRDLGGHHVSIGAEQLPHFLGIEVARERGRSHEIDEHHGELPALRAGRRFGFLRVQREGAALLRRCLQFGNGTQQPLSMPERKAEPFQVTIVKLEQQVEINVVHDEDFEALAESQILQPVAKVARHGRPSGGVFGSIQSLDRPVY